MQKGVAYTHQNKKMDKLFEMRDTTGDEDFYTLLGCGESATVEQISTEFKQLALKYHPDKASSDVERAAAELIFLKLERARTVLLDKDKRAKYDHWRTGGFRHVVTFEKWMNMQSAVHTSMHWAVSRSEVLPLTEPETSQHCHTSKSEEPSTSQPVPASLDEFRRGHSGGSQRNKFRNYDF